jgi:hypothetical protein
VASTWRGKFKGVGCMWVMVRDRSQRDIPEKKLIPRRVEISSIGTRIWRKISLCEEIQLRTLSLAV